jgi:hypothetical protein
MPASGSVATVFNGFAGKKTPAEGAAIAVKFATNFDDNSPNGEFRDDDGIIPWQSTAPAVERLVLKGEMSMLCCFICFGKPS